MKVFIKYTSDKCTIVQKGNWIDLRSKNNIQVTEAELAGFASLKDYSKEVFKGYIFKMIDLGVAMKLPRYFEANIVPRSSSFKTFGFIQTNSMGIIDSDYCGNNDIWKLPVLFIKPSFINVGDRVCQFTIRPSLNAPIWVKLKWLFTSKIEFITVEDLDSPDRGGFGSTGIE